MSEQRQDALPDPPKDLLGTGPIEDHLLALATEDNLPDLAVSNCTLRAADAGPFLRDVLIRAGKGEQLSEEDATLLFRGVYILGGARDSLACQPLLRLLRRPERELDRLLGDALTESMPRIMASVFDGNTDALLHAIADRDADQFARDALLGAATYLTWENRIDRDRMRRFLEAFYQHGIAADGDHAWIGWLQAIALLGLRDLAPLVHRAWDEGRLPARVLDRKDFEWDLTEAERSPDDIGRFERHHLGYIEDVLDALSWTRAGYRYEQESQLRRPEEEFNSVKPLANPWRSVGRNDPCPCGSGRKAKKCCLANG